MHEPSLGQIVRQAMWLDQSAYLGIQTLSNALWYALAIVCLASLSESVGQSLVLFVNQVRPKRFVLSLTIAAMRHVIGYLLWCLTVWLVVRYLFDVDARLVVVATVVGLAYAPQLLAFFELTPLVGNPFALLLSLWSMLAILVALIHGLDLSPWQALLTSALGWALIQLWRRSLGRPIYALGRWLEVRAAGKPLTLTCNDLRVVRRDGNRTSPLAAEQGLAVDRRPMRIAHRDGMVQPEGLAHGEAMHLPAPIQGDQSIHG